ncbi:MAG: YicC family protein [Hyphomicrobiales bacterium]|nr:YicC family protein [Hyphomicrobiales bacterium]
MGLNSMTGFGRAQGRSGAWTWAWEIRTVNAKGLDVRFRLPAGFDALDAPVRAAIGKTFVRGTCHASLVAARAEGSAGPRVNHGALQALIAQLATTTLNANVAPARLDGLLALRGIVEHDDPVEDEAARAALETDILAGLQAALAACAGMRADEGAALLKILQGHIARICKSAQAADDAPGRTVDAVRQRIAAQVEALSVSALDPSRLYQEAVLMAARADVREEIDRLKAHCLAVNELLTKGGAIGRRLDFLAQEMARESNTLCAKSNDAALTAIGLDLKVDVEQFREQVQNVE